MRLAFLLVTLLVAIEARAACPPHEPAITVVGNTMRICSDEATTTALVRALSGTGTLLQEITAGPLVAGTVKAVTFTDSDVCGVGKLEGETGNSAGDSEVVSSTATFRPCRPHLSRSVP